MRKRATINKMQACRSGFTLVEMIVAGILLAAVMSLSAQMLYAVAKGQRTAEQRQMTSTVAANLMERITAQPYETITNQQLQTWRLDSATQSRLPEAKLSISIEPEAGPPAGKRIVIEIQGQGPKGVPLSPVHLTGWVYERQGATP